MLKVENLCKSYGNFEALKNISFSLDDKGVFGFLGPNGAGKSTTMNIITGCLSASSGNVFINGINIKDNPLEAKKLIGFLPEIPPLYPDMKVIEYLRFICEVKKANLSDLEEIMKRTGILQVSGRLIKQLSKGYRQRVGIAQALVGSPKLIILDEPTVGLDPAQIIEIRNLISDLGKDHTVLISSHILSEISAVSNYLVIIAKGKLIASGTLEELNKKYASDCNIKLSVKASVGEAEKIVESVCSKYEKDCNGDFNIVSENDDICEKLFFAFSKVQLPIVRMEVQKTSLEQMFIKLTEGGKE